MKRDNEGVGDLQLRLRDWEQLSDREALGEALTPSEQQQKAAIEQSHVECAAENQVFATLALALNKAKAVAPADDPLVLRALQSVDRQTAPLASTRRWRGRVPVLAALGACFVGALLPWLLLENADVRNEQRSAAVNTALPMFDEVGALPSLVSPALRSVDNSLEFARLRFFSGSVQVDGEAARPGATLREGSRVSVDEGQACISLPQGISACVAPHSELSIENLGHRQALSLHRGRVVSSLEQQPLGASFSVRTATRTFTAVGTVFAVELAFAPGSNQARGSALRVAHGAVLAEEALGSVIVREREQLAPSALTPAPLSEREEQRDAALFAAERLWSAREHSRLSLTLVPAAARVTLDGIELGTGSLAVDVPLGDHQISVQAPGHVAMERSINVGATPLSETIVLAPLDSTLIAADLAEAAMPRRDGTASPSATELLEQARVLRASSQYAAAAQRYHELLQAFPGSAEARGATLSLAELQLLRLGAPAAALRSYESYLASGGNLTLEAHYGKIRALRALGRLAEERAAIVEFLDRYRSTAYGPVLQKRLESL